MKKLKTTDKVIKPTSEKKLVKSLNEDVRVGNQTQTSSFITLLEFIDVTIVKIIHLKI